MFLSSSKVVWPNYELNFFLIRFLGTEIFVTALVVLRDSFDRMSMNAISANRSLIKVSFAWLRSLTKL